MNDLIELMAVISNGEVLQKSIIDSIDGEVFDALKNYFEKHGSGPDSVINFIKRLESVIPTLGGAILEPDRAPLDFASLVSNISDTGDIDLKLIPNMVKGVIGA